MNIRTISAVAKHYSSDFICLQRLSNALQEPGQLHVILTSPLGLVIRLATYTLVDDEELNSNFSVSVTLTTGGICLQSASVV